MSEITREKIEQMGTELLRAIPADMRALSYPALRELCDAAIRSLPATGAGGETPLTDALHRHLVKISEGPNWIAGKDYVTMRKHAEELELALKSAEAAGMERAAEIAKCFPACGNWVTEGLGRSKTTGWNEHRTGEKIADKIRAAAKGG